MKPSASKQATASHRKLAPLWQTADSKAMFLCVFVTMRYHIHWRHSFRSTPCVFDKCKKCSCSATSPGIWFWSASLFKGCGNVLSYVTEDLCTNTLQTEKGKTYFLPTTPEFRTSAAFWIPPPPGVHPFVVLVRAACRRRWAWSIGGMILTGENWSTARTLYSVSGRWMNMEHWWNDTDKGNWSTGRETLYSVGGR
jgi:hypothetical protein